MNVKTERSFRGLLWGLALLGLLLDQGTKYTVFAWLYQHPHYYHSGEHTGKCVVAPDVFELLAQFKGRPDADVAPAGEAAGLTPKVNHGALFGLGGEYVTLANTVFAVISIVAALAIIVWSTRRATARDAALCAALGLILAGTLGNLYDRLLFNGVRDFLHFHWHEYDWPVFNLADCCLVLGAFLLLVQAFWSRSPAGEPTPSPLALQQQVVEVQ
jgi:lipoprotein signal peptidase